MATKAKTAKPKATAPANQPPKAKATAKKAKKTTKKK